ncbi:MAG: beta-ketoacyl synthase chain length factor [Gammaproteobacteria bacterium]
MSTHQVFIEGIGFWASRLPGWEVAREVLCGRAQAPAVAVARPSPALLPPAERRRAPDTVALALEVAARACESAGRDPKSMSSVFASTHGDLAISDALCDTLAKTPLLTSPIKFHNSVHNAAAGYWTIGTGCLKPYTSVSGYHYTFGEGLLEACVQALCENAPVLFVAFEIEARGPVGTMQPSRGVFAGALVISPEAREPHIARLTFEVREEAVPVQSTSRPANAALVEGNAMANGLPFFEALADGVVRDVAQSLAPRLSLKMRITPANATNEVRLNSSQGPR